MISGLSGNEIEKIANITTGTENDNKEEFPDLEDEINKTLNDTERMLENQNTIQQTNHYKKMFTEFLIKNKIYLPTSKKFQ